MRTYLHPAIVRRRSAEPLADLAAQGRTWEAVEVDRRAFETLELVADAAWRAGIANPQYHRKETDVPVLPDPYIRVPASGAGLRHLTADRRRTRTFPDLEFECAGCRGYSRVSSSSRT